MECSQRFTYAAPDDRNLNAVADLLTDADAFSPFVAIQSKMHYEENQQIQFFPVVDKCPEQAANPIRLAIIMNRFGPLTQLSMSSRRNSGPSLLNHWAMIRKELSFILSFQTEGFNSIP
jgi:hypothetical protein